MQWHWHNRCNGPWQGGPGRFGMNSDEIARQQGGKLRLIFILEGVDCFAQRRDMQRGGAGETQRVVANARTVGAALSGCWLGQTTAGTLRLWYRFDSLGAAGAK